MNVNWKRFKTPVRWGIGIGVLAIILLNLSIEDIATELLHLSWVFVFANLIIKFAIRTIVGIKWYLILLIQDPQANFWRALAAHFAGTAMGSVVPVFGADLTVGYAYYRQSGQAASAISSVLMDRVIGAYATVFVGSLALLLNLERFMKIRAILFVLGGVALAAVIAPFAVWGLMRYRKLLVSWWMPAKAKELLSIVRENLEEYRTRGVRMLMMNIGLALVVPILRILSMYTMALAVGAPGSLAEYAVLTPIMFLMFMAPIPVAAIGLEQGVFIVMLGLIGVQAEAAFAMSVVNRVLLTISVLPGIACIVTGWGLNRSAPQQAATPPNGGAQ